MNEKILQGVLIAVIILGSGYLVYSFVPQTLDAPIIFTEKSTLGNLRDTSQVVSLGTCPADEQVIDETPNSQLYRCSLSGHQELVLVREIDGEYTAKLLDTATGKEVTLWTDDTIFRRSWGPGGGIYNYSLRQIDEDLIEASIHRGFIQGSERYSKFINLAEGKLISSVTTITNGYFKNGVTPCGQYQISYSVLVLENEENCYDFTFSEDDERNITGLLQGGILVKEFDPPLRNTTSWDLDGTLEEIVKAEEDTAAFVDVVPSLDGKILNFAIKSLYSFDSGPITISL